MDEDKTREETGEERPTSPRHETLGEVDDGDVKEDANRQGKSDDGKVVRYIYCTSHVNTTLSRTGKLVIPREFGAKKGMRTFSFLVLMASSDNYHPRLCKVWYIRRIAARVIEIHLQSQHL
jgi:hypothetical protein